MFYSSLILWFCFQLSYMLLCFSYIMLCSIVLSSIGSMIIWLSVLRLCELCFMVLYSIVLCFFNSIALLYGPKLYSSIILWFCFYCPMALFYMILCFSFLCSKFYCPICYGPMFYSSMILCYMVLWVMFYGSFFLCFISLSSM